MSKRNRIYTGIVLLFAFLIVALLYGVASDIDSRYREATEVSMVDTAYLLASFLQSDIQNKKIDPTRLSKAWSDVERKRFEAHIFGLTKRYVDFHIYLTDSKGIVIFDSLGQSTGQDFSGWRDVEKALSGEYGARATLIDKRKPESAVMHVAAPVVSDGEIVGVVSIGKPVASQYELVTTARQKLLYVGLITVAAFLILLILVTVWLARPFGLSADLWRVVRQEGYRHPGRLLRRTKSVTHSAFNDMRDALAGRSHTEGYVQTLTHELKSPLTAIRGAAELLREPLPAEQRERFAASIVEQVKRLQLLAERLLELASLEKRRTLDDIQLVDINALCTSVISSLEPVAKIRNITVQLAIHTTLKLEGDQFFLYQALINILANAIDFSPANSGIEFNVSELGGWIEMRVRDHGPGVPDYALDQVYEKFYSLRRPDSGQKSTGLGLTFVREIVALHGGHSWMENHPDGGAVAILSLPATATRL